MRLPDFIIAGAPRSGTTWLYALLDRHPDVYMARPVAPEPKFFLVDSLYGKGLQYYSETWFTPAGTGRVAGEKSTNYLESPAAAERIARDLPQVKLVFILRDPVQRAYSNYLWSLMNGFETLSFDEALAQEDQRTDRLPDTLKFARPFSYFTRGLYADLLMPYFQFFPRDRISVLRFEDAVDDSRAFATRVHRFLGVEPRPEDARDLGAINESDKSRSTLDEALREALTDRYAEPNRRLAAMLGPGFQLWSR